MEERWFKLSQLQTPQLQKNLQVMSVVTPALLRQLQQLHQDESLLFQKQSGVVCCRTNTTSPVWLYGETNPTAEQQILLEKLQNVDTNASLFILLGNTIGYLYARLQPNLLKDTSKRVLILEPTASRLWAMLALLDISEELLQSRIYFQYGNIDRSQIQSAVSSFGMWNEQKAEFIAAPELNPECNIESLQLWYKEESGKQQRNRIQILEDMKKQKKSITIQNVLLVDCWTGRPGSIHLQSVNKVLRQKGVNTHVLPLNYQRINYHEEEYKRINDPVFLNTLQSFQPDLVMSWGYHAPEFIKQDIYDSSNAIWVQVVTNLAYQPKEYFPNERPILVEEKLFPFFHKKGVQDPIYLPLVANEIASTPVNSNRTIPIVFVGNSFSLHATDLDRFRKRIDNREELTRYVQDAVKELSDFDLGLNLFVYMEENPPPQLQDEDDYYHIFRYLLSQGTASRRIQVLESIADKGLMLFGGDWDRALPNSSPLRQCYKQFADENVKSQLTKMGFVFLNIHSVGNATCPNMRFFNTPGGGNFQISDQKQFSTFFEPDQETVFYSSLNELQEQISFYLTHLKETDGIRLQGYERVKKDWNYERWVENAFECLQIQFPKTYS